jgi:hypothetical protein
VVFEGEERRNGLSRWCTYVWKRAMCSTKPCREIGLVDLDEVGSATMTERRSELLLLQTPRGATVTTDE